MKRVIKYIFLVFITFFSCEKEISLDLPPAKNKIVIEGIIETDKQPYVYITKNIGFFDTVDTNTLAKMLILDATVTVSNGTITDTLKPVINPRYVPLMRYESTNITGEEGVTYTLKIEHNGKPYTSKTTIPEIVKIDSLKFSYDIKYDTVGFIWVYFDDPPKLGNFYRAFSKTIGKDSVFVHPTYSIGDDRIVNGQTIAFNLVRGRDPAMPSENYDTDYNIKPPYWFYHYGETIIVKLCSMDAFSYEFWKSVELQYSSNGNPFAAPTTLKTNISGDALGIWCGYAASIDTITITDDVIIIP